MTTNANEPSVLKAGINPNYIIEHNIITFPDSIDKTKIIQPNGIDLYVKGISRIVTNDKWFKIGDSINTEHLDSEIEEGYCLNNFDTIPLKAGSVYKICTDYKLKLPNNIMSYIVPRSSLNRNGIQVGSGWWDSGYEGEVAFTLYPRFNMLIFLPCRLAQMVFFSCDSSYLYDGIYGSRS
jgi:dUTP pyrophosphatase